MDILSWILGNLSSGVECGVKGSEGGLIDLVDCANIHEGVIAK